jgi:hypothetical protein
MSDPRLAAIENVIATKVAAMAERIGADAAAGFCDEIQQMLAERNRKCKLIK